MSDITQSELVELLRELSDIPLDPEIVTYIEGCVYPANLISVRHEPPYTVLEFDSHSSSGDEEGGSDYLDEVAILGSGNTPQWIKDAFEASAGRDPRAMLNEIDLFTSLVKERSLREIMGSDR